MRIAYLADHPSYLPELARLHFQEWGAYRPNDTLEARTERLRSSCGRGGVPTAVVGMIGTALCGSALLLAQDMDTRPDLTPWLAGVFVKPEFRHRGLGAALTRRIMEEAGALDAPKLYLYTRTAESLYASLGWSVVERCDYRGAPAVIMAVQLRAEAG